MLWVLVFTFLLGFSAKSQVAFDEYYQERSLFFESVIDTEEPETYPKKFARIQYFHEDRACSDQSSEMTLIPMHNSYKLLHETVNQWKVAYDGLDVTWEAIGPFEATLQSLGRIDAISTPLSGPEHMQTILIGTPSSGIFKTVDSGQNWVCVTDNGDFYLPGLGCQYLLHDIANPQHIYAAIGVQTLHPLNETGDGYGLGIYRSTNGGESWVPTELEFMPNNNQLITKIIQNPNIPSQMYAASWNKVYRTNDYWSTYDVIYGHNSMNELNQTWCYSKKLIIDLAADPFDWSHVIISSTGVEGWEVLSQASNCTGSVSYHPAEILETFDGQSSSVTWNYLDAVWPDRNANYDSNSPHFCVVEFSHVNQGVVFIATQSFGDAQSTTRVLKKTAGTSFDLFHTTGQTSATPKNNKYQYQFELSPTDDDVFYLGGWNFYRYSHGVEDFVLGSPWNSSYHIDTRALLITQSSPPSTQGANDIVLAGNDGGISACSITNNQLAAQNINGNGLNITQFYGMDLTNRKENVKFTAGAHDGNTCHWNGNSFEHFFSGDDYKMVFSYRDFNLGLFFTQNRLRRLINEGSNSTSANHPDGLGAGDYRWDPPILRHPQDPESFLIGYNNVYKRTGYLDQTDPWTPLSDFINDFGVDRNLRAIAISSTNPDYMLAAFPAATWNGPVEKRLYLTHDGGDNWHDITAATDGFVNTAGISDLIFDELNPHEFYVAFNGFRDDQNNPNKRIVKCSIPSVNNLAGITTVDISNGLPNCPVNVLKWVSGSNRLLLGNDVGVFIYDENQWSYLGDGLPVTVVSDIAIDYHNKDIYITTFGRGFWRASLPCDLDLDGDITLTNDTHWNYDGLLLERNVIVPDGITLTVSEQVNFSANVGIRVMPGGKLVLTEGANLTSACDELWLGIEVWGDADAPQTPSNQGRLIANGGTIQDAHTAVWVRANDDVCNYVEGSGGGIVQLSETTIQNCYVGVQFAPYRWQLPSGATASNISRFTGVTFEQTKPLLGGYLFKAHAILEEVVKVPFKGCVFSDLVANDAQYMHLYTNTGNTMGIGIDSRSASFMVYPWCSGVIDPNTGECLTGELIEPKFSNLRYGVLAGSFAVHEPFSIRGALFEDNLIGVKAYGSEIGPSLVQNTFHISPRPVYDQPGAFSDASVGVLMRSVTGFEIEENVFIGHPSSNYPDLRLIGAGFFNTGANSNECYKNDFDDLDAGVLALKDNGQADQVGANFSGLEFRCNRFGQVAANRFGDMVVGDDSSIKENQGNDLQDEQAGNLFAHLCPNGSEPSDIVVGLNASPFNYFYGTADPAEVPICFSNSDVSNFLVDGFNPCPSNLSSGGSVADLADNIVNTEDILIDTKNVYMGLLDCGDRQVVLDAINNPLLSSMEVRNAMLNCSPYISEAMFTAAFNRVPALSPWHMAQVLLANSPLSQRVKIMMYNAGLDPFYLQLVQNEQNGGPTHRAILESDLAYLEGELGRMRQDYLRLTLLWDEDEADWSAAVNRLEADSASATLLVGALLNAGNLVQATSKLSTMPKSTDEQKVRHLILESRLNGDFCPRYTTAQLALLQSVADDLNSLESGRAYAALMPETESIIEVPLPFPTSKGLRNSNFTTFKKELFLKLFPNPANDMVQLVFPAPDPDTECRFVLDDGQGRQVLELPAIQNGIAEFSVNRLPSGLYIGRLIFDDTVIATEKITVLR